MGVPDVDIKDRLFVKLYSHKGSCPVKVALIIGIQAYRMRHQCPDFPQPVGMLDMVSIVPGQLSLPSLRSQIDISTS